MPDRLIRDELLTSERYWSVSPESRNLYLSILLSADDTGRYTAAAFALRTKCMAGTVSPERIEKLLLELIDVDLVRCYEHQGARYLFIPRYRQRLRYAHSRYPEPPQEINDITEKKTVSRRSQVRPKPAEVKRREEVPLPATSTPSTTSATWSAYSSAYERRWQVAPKRNATVNAQVKALVARLGPDAPTVAAYYLTHNDRYYVAKRHPVGALLRDAEGLHTQCKSGNKATTLEARSAEQKDSLREQVKRVQQNLGLREKEIPHESD